MPADLDTELLDADLDRYRKVLFEIRNRTELAKQHLALHEPSISDLEYGALQLRKIVELIYFGTLVTNLSALTATATAFEKKRYDGAMKLVRQAHASAGRADAYWPKPTLQVRDGNEWRLDEVTEGFLSPRDAERLLGLASSLLHARNPLAPAVNPATAADNLREGLYRIVKLLSHHVVQVLGGDRIVIGLMNAHPDAGSAPSALGDVQVVLFEPES